MFPNEFFAGFSIILTALSLIVSILGWTITYKRQKEILERQIAADLEKGKAIQALSITLAELERVRNWVNAGFKILRFIENVKTEGDKTELIETEKEWEVESSEIIRLSVYLDKRSKTTFTRDGNDCLEYFISHFSKNVSYQFKQEILQENLKQSKEDKYASGSNALDKIEILTQEILGQSIPDYKLRQRFVKVY